MDISFTKSIILEKIMKVGHHSVCTLANKMSFVNQKVHLPRNSFAAHTK